MTENHLDFVHVCLKVDKTLYSDKELKDDKSVVELMREELMQYDREIICLLNLTTKSQVINAQIVSMGTINESIINSREVFKASILSNASQIILMHNHPSGNPEPSKADMAITKKLVTAGKILGIEVIDHIIVGGRTGDSFSFAKGGLMSFTESESLKYIKEVDAISAVRHQKKISGKKRTNNGRNYNIEALERALLTAQEGQAVDINKINDLAEKEKVYLHVQKKFVRKDIPSARGERTFHAVTLPPGTKFMDEDIGGYQFCPLFINEPYIFKSGKRTDMVDKNADYFVIPLLASYEIQLRKAVFTRDAAGNLLKDEQGHYIYERDGEGKPIFTEKRMYPEELKNALNEQMIKWRKEHPQPVILTMPSSYCRTYIKETGESFHTVILPKGTLLCDVDVGGYYFNPLYLNAPTITGSGQPVRNPAYYEIPLLPDREVWLKKDKVEQVNGRLQGVNDESGKKVYEGIIKCLPRELQSALQVGRESYRRQMEAEGHKPLKR